MSVWMEAYHPPLFRTLEDLNGWPSRWWVLKTWPAAQKVLTWEEKAKGKNEYRFSSFKVGLLSQYVKRTFVSLCAIQDQVHSLSDGRPHMRRLFAFLSVGLFFLPTLHSTIGPGSEHPKNKPHAPCSRKKSRLWKKNERGAMSEGIAPGLVPQTSTNQIWANVRRLYELIWDALNFVVTIHAYPWVLLGPLIPLITPSVMEVI